MDVVGFDFKNGSTKSVKQLTKGCFDYITQRGRGAVIAARSRHGEEDELVQKGEEEEEG